MHKRFGDIIHRGFTMVELLIVIAVIGILAAIVTVAYTGIAGQARTNALLHSLSETSKSLSLYKISNPEGDFPIDLADARVVTNGAITLQYSVDNDVDPKTFCVTATIDDVSYHVSSVDNQPSSGLCPGHESTIHFTAGGWQSFPIPWSSGVDHGYGPYYGAYYPSTLHADNSGSLTLFNPYAVHASQGGVSTYLWCRNTSTGVISSTIYGPTFPTFNSYTLTQTINWACPASTVLYAFSISSTPPVSNNNPDSITGTAKSRTWYSSDSPNYKAPAPYVLPAVAIDQAGWRSSPITWSTGTDLGYGPYYGVYFPNNPNKNLSNTESGTLQLYNPYAASRSQGGVYLYYWCKDSSGVVGSVRSSQFNTFSSGAQTREVNWTCPVGGKLFAGSINGSSAPTTYYPNELSEPSKVRFWFSGDSLSAYPSYIESIRTMYGE